MGGGVDVETAREFCLKEEKLWDIKQSFLGDNIRIELVLMGRQSSKFRFLQRGEVTSPPVDHHATLFWKKYVAYVSEKRETCLNCAIN